MLCWKKLREAAHGLVSYSYIHWNRRRYVSTEGDISLTKVTKGKCCFSPQAGSLLLKPCAESCSHMKETKVYHILNLVNLMVYHPTLHIQHIQIHLCVHNFSIVYFPISHFGGSKFPQIPVTTKRYHFEAKESQSFFFATAWHGSIWKTPFPRHHLP